MWASMTFLPFLTYENEIFTQAISATKFEYVMVKTFYTLIDTCQMTSNRKALSNKEGVFFPLVMEPPIFTGKILAIVEIKSVFLVTVLKSKFEAINYLQDSNFKFCHDK